MPTESSPPYRVDTGNTAGTSGDAWGWEGEEDSNADDNIEIPSMSTSRAPSRDSASEPQGMSLLRGVSGGRAADRGQAASSPSLSANEGEMAQSPAQGLSLPRGSKSKRARGRQATTRGRGRGRQAGDGVGILPDNDLFAVRSYTDLLHRLDSTGHCT